MVFGILFRNKSQAQLVEPAPVQLRTPSPSEAASLAHGPHQDSLQDAGTSSTAFPSTNITEDAALSTEVDADALLSLVSSVPPKTLHSYTLKRLPTAEPSIVSSLHNFFADLTPPPLLHCVRCHRDYTEVDNDDRSCVIAHDDDSAEVERVGVKGKGRAAAGSGGYETLWGCCGKTVEGDGDQGPPDGWCYEGRHTTDVKRARFRADSTAYDDKLISCFKLNCHGVRAQRPRSSTPPSPHARIADSYGLSFGVARKRRRSTMHREDQEMREPSSDGETDSFVGELPNDENEGSAAGKKGKGKGKEKATFAEPAPKRKPGRPKKKKDDDMDVDTDAASVKSSKSTKKPRAKAGKEKEKEKQGAKSDNEDAMSVVSSASTKPKPKATKPRKSKLATETTVEGPMEDKSPQKKKTKTT